MTKPPGTPDWGGQNALLTKHISPDIISQWGEQKGTKWLSDLRAEVTAGESVLRETSEGLVRSVSVTRIYVLYNHPTRGPLELVEDRQEFKDGLPTRHRALNCISEKLFKVTQDVKTQNLRLLRCNLLSYLAKYTSAGV